LPVARGNGDLGVQAHAAMLGDAIGGLGIGSRLSGVARLDAIPETSPWLAAVGAGRNARSQRCCGEQSQQRLLAGQRVLVVGMACLHHALDAPPPSGCTGVGIQPQTPRGSLQIRRYRT
jgi:hypothetical protein